MQGGAVYGGKMILLTQVYAYAAIINLLAIVQSDISSVFPSNAFQRADF